MLSLPIYLASLLLAILQSSSADPDLIPVPLPQQCPQYTVIPQFNPTSGSIFANEPSVTLFTNTFLQAVYSSDARGNLLREAFDFSQSSVKEYAEYVAKRLRDTLSQVGVENAEALAEWASRAIPRFDVITLGIASRSYVNRVANFLYVDGYLTMENAQDLASAYVDTVVDSVRANMNSDPKSRYSATSMGFLNFIFSLELYTKQKAPILVFYIGNEWFVADVNYRFM